MLIGRSRSCCKNFKIFTKILANRLNKYIARLIHPDQVGFVTGREEKYNRQDKRVLNAIYLAHNRGIPNDGLEEQLEQEAAGPPLSCLPWLDQHLIKREGHHHLISTTLKVLKVTPGVLTDVEGSSVMTPVIGNHAFPFGMDTGPFFGNFDYIIFSPLRVFLTSNN